MDILDTALDCLHIQAAIAVDMSHHLEEQRRKNQHDLTTIQKELATLNAVQLQQKQKEQELYEAFVMKKISKADYITAKTSNAQRQADVSAQIVELKTILENVNAENGLQNRFISSFQKYVDIHELTQEIVDDVVDKVLIYPSGRFEILWKYQDELEKLLLELSGEKGGTP